MFWSGNLKFIYHIAMCSVYCVDNFEITLCILSMFIFQWGMTPLIAACVEGQSETARLLIENGADLNEKRLVYDIELCHCMM